MTTLYAIDGETFKEAMERLNQRLAALESRFDEVEIKPLPEWVPLAEYARMKSVDVATVRRWITLGKLEARGVNKGREVKAR